MSALLLAWAAAAAAQAPIAISSSTVSEPHQLVRGPVEPPADKKLPVFPEHLLFDVAWGFIGVGRATLAVEDVVDFNGRPAYHVVSRAISNKFCDGFYKVRDLNESWIDIATMHSLGYSKKLREGSFFRDEWVLFDGGRWLAKKVEKNGVFSYLAGASPAKVHDILSSMYYVRTHELKDGQEIVLDVNTKQNWPLVVRVIKRHKGLKTPAGVFDTILVEPAMRQEGIFIQKGKRLQIWLSDDARRMPVQMKVEVFFGHITAKLSKVL